MFCSRPAYFFIEIYVTSSVTRLGDFWKFLVTKILPKVAQIISNFLGHFEQPHSYVKTYVGTSWSAFGNIFATFYFNILSHWSLGSLCNVNIVLLYP